MILIALLIASRACYRVPVAAEARPLANGRCTTGYLECAYTVPGFAFVSSRPGAAPVLFCIDVPAVCSVAATK